MQLDPCKDLGIRRNAPGRIETGEGTERAAPLFLDEGEARRRRGRGGEARVGRALPRGGLGAGWDGRRRQLYELRRLAVVVHGGGGTPARFGGGSRAGEVH